MQLRATEVIPRHPPGPPMTLGNMRQLGVHVVYCLGLILDALFVVVFATVFVLSSKLIWRLM